MARIENQLPLNNSGPIDRTSQLINDGENGNSKYIELVDLSELVSDIVGEISEPRYYNFSDKVEVTIHHDLGKIPNVTILIGEEEIFADIYHTPDLNSLVVTFSTSQTGVIVVQ